MPSRTPPSAPHSRARANSTRRRHGCRRRRAAFRVSCCSSCTARDLENSALVAGVEAVTIAQRRSLSRTRITFLSYGLDLRRDPIPPAAKPSATTAADIARTGRVPSRDASGTARRRWAKRDRGLRRVPPDSTQIERIGGRTIGEAPAELRASRDGLARRGTVAERLLPSFDPRAQGAAPGAGCGGGAQAERTSATASDARALARPGLGRRALNPHGRHSGASPLDAHLRTTPLGTLTIAFASPPKMPRAPGSALITAASAPAGEISGRRSVSVHGPRLNSKSRPRARQFHLAKARRRPVRPR
jgi:hypothetical protein